ncbi:MAG: hypothetical protein ACI9FJ_002211, partial [Alteromonadaceae bacterium]
MINKTFNKKNRQQKFPLQPSPLSIHYPAKIATTIKTEKKMSSFTQKRQLLLALLFTCITASSFAQDQDHAAQTTDAETQTTDVETQD